MATSGSKTVNVTSDGLVKLIFGWTAGEQNIANNYTPVNWILQIQNTSSSNKISSAVTKTNTTKVNEKTLFNDSVSINCNPGITRTLVSGVTNIPHNANGTKTFTFEISQYFGSVYYPNTNTIIDLGTITFNGSGTLDAIPRPSVLGTINNFTIGNEITIPVTKYTSTVSDTLNIYVGDTWIKRIEGLTNNQSISFTQTEINNIYATMPNVTSAVFRFVNTSYNGTTDVIGTSTKTATGSINANVKPTISNVSLVEAVSGIATKFGAFIQSKSKINGTITATAGAGSSIESYSIKINGVSYTSRTFTTDFLTTAGTGSNTNKNNQCIVTVTDKRGRIATTTVNITVVAYTAPFISNLSVTRCNADGSFNDNGTYAKISGTATIISISNKNNKTFKLEYKKTSESTWTTVETYTSSYTYTLNNKIVSNINADVTYDFRVTAQDYFDTTINQYPLSSGYTIIDLNASGKGIAFGKVSDKNAMQIGMTLYDRFDTEILNGLSKYESGGQTDVNTTLEELVLSSKNTPDTGFWYVRTMFYSTKAQTTNRTQMAYPYNSKKPIYCRYYINGTGWSEWAAIDVVDSSFADTNGYIHFANGLLIQWGRFSITPTAANTVTSATITFPKAYDNVPKVNADPHMAYPNMVTSSIGGGTTTDASKSGMVIYMTRTNVVATPFQWMAIGYKSV